MQLRRAVRVSGPVGRSRFGGAFVFGFPIALPGAAALAILRYGLYEIDVIINKSIVYFSLAAVITAIYVHRRFRYPSGVQRLLFLVHPDGHAGIVPEEKPRSSHAPAFDIMVAH